MKYLLKKSLDVDTKPMKRIAILLLFQSSLTAFSQGVVVTSDIPRGTELLIPCTYASDNAELRIQNFLRGTSSELEALRLESGTSGTSLSEVRPVDNPSECQNISNFILGDPKYQHSLEGIDRTRYHYQTNDFYFVFWIRNRIGTGPQDKFIVIKKDFSQAWVYWR